jgi:hypothetical protein
MESIHLEMYKSIYNIKDGKINNGDTTLENVLSYFCEPDELEMMTTLVKPASK